MKPTAAKIIDLSGDAFAPLSYSVRLAFMLGPPFAFGLALLLTGLLVSPGAAGFVISMAVATVGGGKLVILAGAVERAPVGPWALAALIVYIDLATALIMLGGIHYLYRLPWIGRRMAGAREMGWRLLERNPWVRRATWLSLAAFVAVPFYGTGALMGAVMGRMLGLSRWSIVICTVCGSLFGSSALALASDYWAERINAIAQRPVLGFVLVVMIVSLMILGSHWLLGHPHGTGARDGSPPT